MINELDKLTFNKYIGYLYNNGEGLETNWQSRGEYQYEGSFQGNFIQYHG